MSVPPLRQPKIVDKQQEKTKRFLSDLQYVIISLKDKSKLVVTSDAYNGIITSGQTYQCVFCQAIMKLDSGCKDNHVKTVSHRKMLEKYPHIEEYSQNLVRELSNNSSFCTICNVVVANIHLLRHLSTEVHKHELGKAVTRADTYKPF